jgi:putative DNA primase/helicase
MRVLIDFERAGTLDDPAMAAIDVLRELDYEKPTNGQCRDCAAILREHFGEPKKIKGIMKWRIPKAQQFNQFPDLPESVDLA